MGTELALLLPSFLIGSQEEAGQAILCSHPTTVGSILCGLDRDVKQFSNSLALDKADGSGEVSTRHPFPSSCCPNALPLPPLISPPLDQPLPLSFRDHLVLFLSTPSTQLQLDLSCTGNDGLVYEAFDLVLNLALWLPSRHNGEAITIVEIRLFRGVDMITSDDIHSLYRPSLCRKRVYLLANRPELAAPPSEYDQLVMECGLKHEQVHLETCPQAVKPDYRPGDLKAGAEATRALLEKGTPVIYQGVVSSELAGLAGIPDFLIRKGESYVLQDTKLAVNLENHPEIPLQLSLYARAFEDRMGKAAAGLKVVLGNGNVEDIVVEDIQGVVKEIGSLKKAKDEPDEAVGWSKCGECPFRGYCWEAAEKNCDPAVVFGVDQNLRNTLVEAGIDTYHKLLNLPVESLAELRKPWGKREQRVGNKTAENIHRQIRVLIGGKHEVFDVPQFPSEGPCVYFDIESDPHDEGLENKVYLWGVLADCDGSSSPEYWGELAGVGEENDKQAWFDFLNQSESIFRRLGNIPFIHYSPYEKTWTRKYIERWGDPNGIGGRISTLLWDMQAKAIKPAICLPIPSYGLKHVEKYAGFERGQQDYGSLWSVVRYHEWLKAATEDDRRLIGQKLLLYNREDCEAMRYVLNWLKQIVRGR